ncbi:hypothetical protein ACROYT_G035766 [Oculina patagonica]
MAGAESKLRLKVYLDEGQREAEIFVTPATKCRDIVQRLQRQIHETDCFLIEVWQGCERLVPDNESILSTLLEWGSDLEDVKFYLRPQEDTPSYTQVLNGPSSQVGQPSRVNGFKEEPPLVRDVLLGGSRISVNDLKEVAARQQQEIVAKERELKARQIQLMEMKRKSQNKPQSPYIQQLAAKADEQDQRLTALRHMQDQVDSYKLSNTDLAEELDDVRSLFMEKEKELAIAVAKVESLTQQLDKQRKGWSQSSPSREKTHQELELERLRKELMTRNELNHQQSVQIQSQKQLLAEKHKELFELDAQIDKYTNDLRQKRSQNNHITSPNHPVNGSVSSTDEQDFVDMDYYSNLGSFSKRLHKNNSADSNSNGSTPVTSGSFRGRARNARKLEPLLEVEEEVSDGHASCKSSTEDLTQGPGPPRASRVTALKSRFEAEGGNRRSSPERDSRGNKEVSSSSKLRVAPEGVETPVSAAPEMFDLDEVRGKRDMFLDISSLKINPPERDAVENTETRNQALQVGAFEVPHSLEIKHILGGLDLKTEAPSCSTESSTPSDGGDYSGPSSPSSLSSSSSVSSNSTSPKTAVFAITGVAKKSNSFPRLSEPPQHRNAETDSKALPQRGLQGLRITAQSQGYSSAKKFQSFSAEPEKPNRRGLTSERGAEDHLLQTRLVKSEAFPTKNENVGSIARATVLDFSRTGIKTKRFDETSKKQNEATTSSDGQKVPSLTEVKALDAKPDRTGVSSNSDGEQVPNLTELKTADSLVKTGKVQLSRLRYSPAPPLNSATTHQRAMFNSESHTRFERKAVDSSPNSNSKIPEEDTKKAVDSSLQTNNKALTNAPQNSNRTNDFKPSPSVQKPNEGDKYGHALDIHDEADNAKSLSQEQSAGSVTVDRSQVPSPLTFKPISFRAKKLAAEQSNKNTSDNRSQLAPPISNSISVRGQSSSLTRITVTPAASYYSTKSSANIPEKRSPVPTSKRQRFIHRGAAPTYPEAKELLSNEESGGDALVESIEQKHEEFVDKESFVKESTLTNLEQGNKARKTPRSDAKQVVSSFNIQLSSQSRKQNEQQGDTSSSSEQSKGTFLSEGNQFNSDSGRLSSESGRLSYESSRLGSKGDRLSSESGRLSSKSGRLSSVNGNESLESSPTASFTEVQKPSTVNSENVGGGNFTKNQLEQRSRNVFTSSLLKPLSPSKQFSSPQKSEETSPSNNAAQKLMVSSNGELLQSKLSPTRTQQSDNMGDINSERTPMIGDHFDRNVATNEIVTIKDFPLKVTDVDTGIHVSVNGDIGLASQSNNPISDQSSGAIKDSPVTTMFDDKTKPVFVNGDVALLNHSHEDLSKESFALEESAEGESCAGAE